MKICFILYGNLYLTPYIKNYLEVFNDEECDIICWNRHRIEETISECNVMSFARDTKDNKDNKIKKMIGYIQYTAFVRRKLLEKKYDLVVNLQSIGGVFNSRILLKNYKDKYIIDVRDYSIEGIPILRNVEYKLLRNSRLNVISSEGYKNFLPNDCAYQVVHNYSDIRQDIRQKIITRDFAPPFSLSYIGLIRFQEQNKKIIDLFANDTRFQINFIGKNAYELENYIAERDVKNVRLIDQFSPGQTLEFYAQTDAILNVYGNHTPLLDYALSNKLYFAAALHMPILVSKDTYMEKISTENGFGFVLDFEDSGIKDKLYNYMLQHNTKQFTQDCDAFMKKVQKENKKFTDALYKIKYKEETS